jgi:hypothetical protein
LLRLSNTGDKWSVGEMILTGATCSTGRETRASSTLLATNSKQTGLELKLSLQSERPPTNCLSYGTTGIVVDGMMILRWLIRE